MLPHQGTLLLVPLCFFVSGVKKRDVLESEIPVAACPMAPDGECMCVLCRKTGRKMQVELSEISLCSISSWETAATPSFL